MRIAIVDDRAADREELLVGITRWCMENDLPLVPAPAMYESGEALLADFDKNKYDVVFLDIYMDGMTGMDAARRIRELDNDCRLIFTTTSTEFAVDSYEVASSYYLVKPYGYGKLAAAMQRSGAAHLEQGQMIEVCGERLLLHRIAWAEYAGRKVRVHFTDGQQEQFGMGWNEFAVPVLAHPYFCDCMKGMLVNFEAVKKLTEDSFLLQSGAAVPISRLKYKEVRQQFFDWSYRKARGGLA